MSKTKVYLFTSYDITTDKEVVSQRPATIEAIAFANGKVIKETEQEVEIENLDGNGFLNKE